MPSKKRKKKKRAFSSEMKLIAALLLIAAVAAAAWIIADKKTNNNDGSEAKGGISSTREEMTDDASTVSGEESSQAQSTVEPSSVTASVTVSLPSKTAEEKIYSEFDDSKTAGNTPDSWNLMLVNADNTLDESYEPELNKTQIYGVYNGMYVSSKIYDAYIAMFNAAKADGVTLSACSAYRPYSSQLRNFTNRVNKYISEGYSKEEAERITATIIARPGTSEHQTGLVIDFNPCDDSFENSAAYRWLQKNAENYGFVQRYKKSKSSITGIVNESWHYRYVGVYTAKCMNELDMCLEEYIEYISK
ncbi:MAG: M15 family metallopeptidase [Acutalibacteraceae bacterium]